MDQSKNFIMHLSHIPQYNNLEHKCAHFCSHVVHCGMWDRCTVKFVHITVSKQYDRNTLWLRDTVRQTSLGKSAAGAYWQPFIQYIQIRRWNKNNCTNADLKWEIGRFDGEPFTHMCMTSPAKRADVTCKLKPEGRRPEPLFNIPRTAYGPPKARIWKWIYSIHFGKGNSVKITHIPVDWRPAFAATKHTVGERTVALKIIARCSITQTPTGQSKVWWWHARKMIVIYFKRI